MLLFFDEGKSFINDLSKFVDGCNRWKNPLVVLPTLREVKAASEEFDNITFITYDYWLSKKWIADDVYDHIDFFRIDQFLIAKSYGVRIGSATVKRTKKRVNDELKGENE